MTPNGPSRGEFRTTLEKTLHKPRHVEHSRLQPLLKIGLQLKQSRQQSNKMDLRFGESAAITDERVTRKRL